MHRAVAEAIEAQTRGRIEGRAAELAYHWALATTPDDIDKAIGYAKAAGDEALGRLAPDEALRSYGQALTLLEQRGRPDEWMRCSLLLGLGDAQRQTGNAAYRETLLDAARLAQAIGDTEVLVVAALANSRGAASQAGLVDRERVAVLEAAIAAVEGEQTARHARLLGTLAIELSSVTGASKAEVEQSRARIDQAIEMTRSTDPAAYAELAWRRSAGFLSPEHLGVSLALMAEAAEGVAGVNDPTLQYWLELSQGLHLCMLARVPEAESHWQAMLEYAHLVGQPSLLWTYEFFVGAGLPMLRGDFEDAEAHSASALELGLATGQPDAATGYAAQLGVIRFSQGRTAEIVDLLLQAAVDTPGLPALVTFGGCVFVDVDRPDDARSWIEPFVADDFAAVPVDLYWTTAMGFLAYAIERLEWREAAAALVERIRPYPDQLAYCGATAFGSLAQWAGLLEALLGRREEAVQHFALASDMCSRNGIKWGLAMNELAWGRYLSEWDGPGDRVRATELLTSALGAARQHGYGMVERRAATALEALA
jgi:tetratricopeptide (TPR) repeat protein